MAELTPKTLDELERLHAAATPGHWVYECGSLLLCPEIADTTWFVGEWVCNSRERPRYPRSSQDADGELLAALLRAAPALLAAARRESVLAAWFRWHDGHAERRPSVPHVMRMDLDRFAERPVDWFPLAPQPAGPDDALLEASP